MYKDIEYEALRNYNNNSDNSQSNRSNRYKIHEEYTQYNQLSGVPRIEGMTNGNNTNTEESDSESTIVPRLSETVWMGITSFLSLCLCVNMVIIMILCFLYATK